MDCLAWEFINEWEQIGASKNRTNCQTEIASCSGHLFHDLSFLICLDFLCWEKEQCLQEYATCVTSADKKKNDLPQLRKLLSIQINGKRYETAGVRIEDKDPLFTSWQVSELCITSLVLGQVEKTHKIIVLRNHSMAVIVATIWLFVYKKDNNLDSWESSLPEWCCCELVALLWLFSSTCVSSLEKVSELRA